MKTDLPLPFISCSCECPRWFTV